MTFRDAVKHTPGPRKISGGQRKPRDEANAMCFAILKHRLTSAINEVIAILHSGDVEHFRCGLYIRHGDLTQAGVPDDAAVAAALVLHAFSVLPSLFLGLFFAARVGLNIAGMRQIADRAEEGRVNV